MLELKPKDIEFADDMLATKDLADDRFNDLSFAFQFAENQKYKQDTTISDGCSLVHL